MAGLSSKKLFIAFMAMLTFFFMAVVFQNFSFKKDDYGEVYDALQGAVKASDEDHAAKRKVAEPQDEAEGRRINAIQDNAGFGVDDAEPAAIELSDKSLKQ
jgi:myo-inositol-hexaphosphate 3-phosphohydrolase